MRRKFIAVLSFIRALGTFACGTDPNGDDSVEHTGTSTSAIISGTNSDASQDSVVLIVGLIGKEVFMCSGTLVAQNLILTARHCVSEVSEGGFTCNADGTLGAGSTGGKVGADYPVTTFYIFTGPNKPDFSSGKVSVAAKVTRVWHDEAAAVCGHDLALLQLDRAIPGAKIAQMRLDNATTVGEKFTAVGWGITSTTSDPQIRQQRSDVAVKRVGPAAGSDSLRQLPVPANEFEVGEVICQGDSGGPAFSATTGAVMGVVSTGGNGLSPTADNPARGCTGTSAVNQYMMLPAFKVLIGQAFAAVGQEPWAEGQANPALAKDGERCVSDGDCRSNTCAALKCVAAPKNEDDGGCSTGAQVSGTRRTSNGFALGGALAVTFAALFGRRRRR